LNIIRKIVDFDRKNHVLERIGASNQVTIADIGVFRIKQEVTHTIPQTPVKESVEVK
jgi:hypothetical protein